jgi:hypothetical protein
MTTKEYLSTRTFGLLYYCDFGNLGRDLNLIPNFWTDSKGKSRVISARVAARTFKENDFKFNVAKIKSTLVSDNSSIYGDVGAIELFLWIKSAQFAKVKELFRNNRDQIDNIRAMYNRYKGPDGGSIECAIFLLDLTEDESGVKEEEIKDCRCLKLKRGGLEIIYEYLASAFLQEYEELQNKTYPDGVPYESIFPEYTKSNDVNESEYLSPCFKFSLHSDFGHLTKNKIEHYVGEDDEYEYPFERGAYPYFNLNLKIIENLNKQLIIPWRIKEILTDEQLKKLPEIFQNVIMDNIDLIFESCFKQRHFMPKESSNLHRSYDTWGSSMYASLGGDGCGSIYLSDGMSIRPDGTIDDDD